VTDEPWGEGPSIEDRPGRGSFPGDFVSPVWALSGSKFWLTGTAALLGGGRLLTAAHVLDVAAEHIRLFVTDTHERSLEECELVEWERHPDPRVDLAVGRIEKADTDPPFLGIGHPAFNTELCSIGFPAEHIQDIPGSGKKGYDPRFLKGHATRMLPPGSFAADAPSIELSYPIPEGMSGSPVYLDLGDDRRFLFGVAIRNYESHLARHESILQKGSAEPERVYRVVEYGVSLLLSPFIEWEIGIANGRTLAALVGESGKSS